MTVTLKRLNQREAGAHVYEARVAGWRCHLVRKWNPGTVVARGMVGGSYPGWHSWELQLPNGRELPRRVIEHTGLDEWDTLAEARTWLNDMHAL